MEELSQFDMTVQHRPGKLHRNADALSRLRDDVSYCDCYMAGRKVEDLPCGGCPFCRRAHQQWSRFEEDVDDVVPLAVRAVSYSNSASTGVLDEPQGDQEARRSKVNSLSKERFREEQAKDPDLELILRWLHFQQDSSPLELSLMSPASKYYWLHRTQPEPRMRWFIIGGSIPFRMSGNWSSLHR